MIKRNLFRFATLTSTCIALLACQEPETTKKPGYTSGSNTDSQNDHNTDVDHNTDIDTGECQLEEIVPNKNAACKSPEDQSVFLMDDGYGCYFDNDCKGGFCNPETFTCGASELAKYEFTDLPLYSTCLYDGNCASGHCVWFSQGAARCLNKCEPGDSGDGIFACTKGTYPSANPDYYCQPDTRIGQKCCSDKDCPNHGICYNNYCSTDCTNVDQGYTCPENSKCYSFFEVGQVLNLCVADSLKGQLKAGQKCSESVFCQSGHCNPDYKCADLSQVNCSGPKDYPKFSQPNGYPCNVDQDCASGVCNLSAYICTATANDIPHAVLVTNLENNMPCQEDNQCASGYCWYNGGSLFGQLGISDASYCAQPCLPDVAQSDGNFACQLNNFDKYICSPVRDNKGEKGTSCVITEFACKTGLTCSRTNKVCTGM